MSNNIQLIEISKIHYHKDNPRKEIGDVSELAESIKANGILQNLTVVPDGDGNYTVVIGHRRLTAARQAGIEYVPCAVVEMSDEEQLSTMLTENMQRSDLSVYEQAVAFKQLSIDFGLSDEEIAKKSGFSKATVKSRMQLANLDEGLFKKAVKRGATLFEFAELNKLEKEEDRNQLLQYVGTSDFKNKLKTKLAVIKTEENLQRYREIIKTFATEVIDYSYQPNGKVKLTLKDNKVVVAVFKGSLHGYSSGSEEEL